MQRSVAKESFDITDNDTISDICKIDVNPPQNNGNEDIEQGHNSNMHNITVSK